MIDNSRLKFLVIFNQIVEDLEKESSRWLVLEPTYQDDIIVACANIDVHDTVVQVKRIAALGESEGFKKAIKILLSRIELIADSLGKTEITIDVSSNEEAIVEAITSENYCEYGGYLQSVEQAVGTTVDIMVLSHKKNLFRQEQTSAGLIDIVGSNISECFNTPNLQQEICGEDDNMGSLISDLFSALHKEYDQGKS